MMNTLSEESANTSLTKPFILITERHDIASLVLTV